MFPHTITVYHYSVAGSTETYTKQIISDVYVQEQYGVSKSGKGLVDTKSVTITTSKAMCDTFGDLWTVYNGDRVVIGVGDDISKFADIPTAYTITNIILNKCGSFTDNVVLVGA